MLLFPLLLVLLHDCTGGGVDAVACGLPTCADVEKIDRMENEALGMELLQYSSQLLERRKDEEGKSKPSERGRDLGSCRRVDARSITVEELHSSLEPLILTHAFEIRDPLAWEKSKFIGDGVWANVSVPPESYSVNDKFFHEDIEKGEWVPLREAIEYDGPSFVALQKDVARPMMDALATLNGGAHTVPPLSTILADFSNHFIMSMSTRGQWAGMHSHNSTLFVQVAGRKGWVLGDSEAWADLDIHGVGVGNAILNEPISESYLSHAEVCGAFLSNEPQAIFRNPEHFLLCTTGPGEALFFPGFCDGTCGWWHATCGLDDWNPGFSRQCFLEDCPR